MWRIDSHRLVPVWSGRHSVDGVELELEVVSPTTLEVRDSQPSCQSLVPRIRSKFGFERWPGKVVVPFRLRDTLQRFCDQIGKYEWSDTRFERVGKPAPMPRQGVQL